MARPDISVLIPARNEGNRIAETIHAISQARRTSARLEFVIVDDASTDDTTANLVAAVPELLSEPKIDVQIHRLSQHSGIDATRNHTASLAAGDIFFITDAHVRFSEGWDELVMEYIRPDRILSGTTTQKGSIFRGYGCDLIVPLMGITWNYGPVDGLAYVPVAPSHGTVIPKELFERLGGYDSGMILYGAGEPEFSIRAWLHGAEVVVAEGLQVEHEFKPKEQLREFISNVRPFWVHNCLRFGFLYLSELGCMQMLRYFSRTFPEHFQAALQRVNTSDVWQRRSYLESQHKRSFAWLVDYFGIKDQAGGEII
ncbi:MAG TPA: glycosyltransferase [Acidobacteriaceae bacterium]|nr:glycosyltransferase [Acidobacteriaceae bacterium]